MFSMPIVHVVDDDAQARKAVSTLVQAMSVEAREYASAEEFLDAYDGARPACLVTDVRMLGMSGLELQEELIARRTPLAVIVLTAYATIPGAVRAMRNGALTLLEKPCRDDELWEAIRDALAADRQADVARQAIDEARGRFAMLSPKERAVLACIAAGDPNKAIAAKLEVSVRTVEIHRQNIFQKMQANSLAELIRTVVSLEQT